MFENKVVVITGGANGIGRCIAEEFRSQGAKVCIIDTAPGDHFVGDLADRMDLKLLEAARDLGCGSVSVLRRVIFPLSMPGVISGVTMVLIPSVSTFYISQKLGNGKFFLIGDAIEGQYVANNLHFAAAIAFIMMIILLVGMALMRKLADRHVQGGV